MILYFTGTGNSRYVAKFLGDKLNDQVHSLNSLIKKNAPQVFCSEKPYIIVAPVYAWRYPKVVKSILNRSKFTGTKKIYFVATMGANTGELDKYCEKFAVRKKLEYKGFCGVPMPDNYVISDMMPDKKKVEEIITAAEPRIQKIADAIAREDRIRKSDDTKNAWLLSSFVNFGFRYFANSSKNYVVSDKCTGCGTCEKLCPTNNIKMNNGKPVFAHSCTHCFACIQYCPKAAIDIKGKTENHGRYVCPLYTGK